MCPPQNRPETGAYLGTPRASGLLFVQSLDERWGDVSRFGGNGLGDTATGRSAWQRGGALGMTSTSGTGFFKADTTSGLFQGGSDAAQWSLFNSTDKLHLGVMAGYGSARTDANASGSPFEVRGRTTGGSAGVYGTWFENDKTRLGWYTDVWGQLGWLDRNADTLLINPANDYAHVGMASAEAGYALRLGDGSPWVIKPQGQLIYLRSNNYNLTQSDFSSIEGVRRAGWMSRLGVRVQPDALQGSSWRLRPYAAVNWWHDETGDEALLNAYSTKDLYPGNRYELKAGVNVDFTPGLAAWGDMGWQWGSQSYQAWTVRAGMKYAW